MRPIMSYYLVSLWKNFVLAGSLIIMIAPFTLAQTPLPIPFYEDFESGQWNINFASGNHMNSLVEITSNYGPRGNYHLLTHSKANGLVAENQVDIHLDMRGASRDIFFRFFAKELNPDSHQEAALWFSDDGGRNFTKLGELFKLYRFTTIHNWQSGWKIYTINMTDFIRPYGLILNSHCVIRMQTQTQNRAPSGGIAFDNISVQEEQVIETGELPERTLYYYLSEIEFIDIINCGRIDCPPIFNFNEGLLDKDFWTLHEGDHGKAFLEKNEQGFHIRLNTLSNKAGYAVSTAAFRFDASPWSATDPDVDPAIVLKFNWKSDIGYLTPYDAVYISDNGGETYAKIHDFSENNQNPGKWQETTLNLSDLTSAHDMTFSDRFVVVFQHFNDLTEGSPGYTLDNVVAKAQKAEDDPDSYKSYNYPNPFSQETKISFELAQESDIRLKILDSQGREVQTLAGNKLSAGEHTLLWDGRDRLGRAAGPGIYFYILETAQGIETKRIFLEK